MKRFIYSFLILAILVISSESILTQNYRYNAYRLGIKAGAGLNFAGLGYQNLSQRGGDFIEFHMNDGTGLVPYFGIYGEYLPDAWWGLHLGISYDSRNALVYDDTFDPASEFDLMANYISLEPRLVINQKLIPELTTYFGMVAAFNLNNEYSFKPDENDPSYLEEGIEVDNFRDFTYGFNLGFAYDIPISDQNFTTRYYISPFLEASWLARQKHPDFGSDQDGWDDTWGTVSLRAGVFASVEFVDDARFSEAPAYENLDLVRPVDDEVVIRQVNEIFPLVHQVFFDEGSTDIPARYIQLSKAEADGFEEEDITDLTANPFVAGRTRTEKQMYIYHNNINIFGERMRENSSAELTLVGSDPKGTDGEIMAQNIKDYLVNVFEIDEDRINIKGQEKPRVPSGTSRTPADDRPLVDEENRRVEFVFNDVEMLREAEIKVVDEASLDNDLIFALNRGLLYESWSIVINGENISKSYGPFTNEVERINPVDLLADVDGGVYTARIIINRPGGETITEEAEFRLTKVVDDRIGQRFSILFEYAREDAVAQYDETLRNEIADRIPDEGHRVIVHGHTDEIGNENTNRRLSIDRANEVKRILDEEFSNEDKNVPVESIGFGEREMPSKFDDALPEGRFYNRNVIIDIVPVR